MVGIGIIGLGVMGRRFISGLKANPDFLIRGAYDPAPVETDVPRVESVAALLSDPAVACIYIATPPATHEELVRAVVDAGKAVFCEKPLTADPASARRCLEAVERAGVPAAVNFPFATAPAAVRMKELVETGALGEDLSAHLTLRFRTWPRGWQQGAAGWLAGPEQGGFTREVVSHFMFLAGRLFGPGRIVEKQVERGPNGSETRLHAVLHFAKARMTIDAAVEGEAEEFNRFEVKGSRDIAAMSEWYRLTHSGGDIEPARADGYQIAELARLLSGQKSRLATVREAADVVDLIEGILAASGRAMA
ncbi:Gfo/Idh/MocA family protein [Microvirga subterranea]|uniref:Putative dehydrogenase n=1 Tax=Microvirga subterranea TaxID=186651 RepID=A0A370HV66_9HYPH|nr:Gfo/Idh/MocA family oxidoreductase [Microvirga subterranea]RDI62406.1 putative dehydrogenase [Microvirga subterranea]